jgi:hydrogenase maturation factor
VLVEGPDVPGSLRLLARPGDALLVLGSAADATSRDLLLRSQAWGLTRIWLGAGLRPHPGQAEHVVWGGAEDGAADECARSGDLVVLYHVLWELTHVVFEHPGLLTAEPGCESPEACITCSDAGQVAEVQRVDDDGRAETLVGGVTETIDVSLVDPVGPGHLVLVHAGVAVAPVESVVVAPVESVVGAPVESVAVPLVESVVAGSASMEVEP